MGFLSQTKNKWVKINRQSIVVTKIITHPFCIRALGFVARQQSTIKTSGASINDLFSKKQKYC